MTDSLARRLQLGETPLHKAAGYGDVEVVRTLLPFSTSVLNQPAYVRRLALPLDHRRGAASSLAALLFFLLALLPHIDATTASALCGVVASCRCRAAAGAGSRVA